MRWVGRILLTLLALSPAGARSLYWERVDVAIRVTSEGLLEVSEAQEYVFDGAWNGGYRDLDLRRVSAYTDIIESSGSGSAGAQATSQSRFRRRAVNCGCSLSPNDILITSGAVEAVDLCLMAVCNPGDIVAIESPMYFGTLQTLEAHGIRALEIPTHPRDGISLDALDFAIKHNPIRAVVVISNFNNPLGSMIPDDKKKELVKLLARHDIPLIENDVSGEIYFGEKRPLTCKAFDKKGLVMLCSSFSKDISPGLRVGWAVPGRYQAQVEWLKFTLSASSATLPQMAVAAFLESGGYEQLLRRIRREYARNIELMSAAVMRHFPAGTRVTRPAGGFVLWVQLPERVDSLELYKRALKGGITLAPGHVFSATWQYSNFIRLNAAAFNYPIERALERLGEIIGTLAA